MRPAANLRTGADLALVVLLAGGAAVLVLGLDLWAALWLSVAVSHGSAAMQGTPAALHGATALLRGLGYHPAHPYDGYPSLVAAMAPTAILFWTLAALVAVAAGVPLATAAAWTARWLRAGVSSSTSHGGARWATLGDLRRICTLASPRRLPPVGVILGWWGRRVLVSSAETHVLLAGSTRSGKTTTVVIPTLLAWHDGGVVATSTKAELVRLVGPYRAAVGPVAVFAPLETDTSWITSLGLEAVTWNPVNTVTSAGTAAELADLLTAEGRRAGSDPIWYSEAANLLTALLLHQAECGGDLAGVLALLQDTKLDAYAGLALVTADETAQRIFTSIAATPERTAGGIIATARSCLALWNDERIAAATVAHPKAHDLAQLVVTEGGTLLLTAPLEEAERCRALFSALFQHILRHGLAEAQRAGGVLPRRVLMSIDEPASFARIPRLASYLATAAGQGITFLLAYQDFAQIEASYGLTDARSIVNNCRARLLLPNQGDARTLDAFSHAVGHATTVYEAPSWNAAGGVSYSQQRSATPLAAPDMLAALDDGERVLLYAKRPARINARPYYAVRPWRTALERAAQAAAARPPAPLSDLPAAAAAAAVTSATPTSPRS